MVEPIIRQKFATPVDRAVVDRDWQARGFSCHAFVDPPGREWNDFLHLTAELVTVVEGRLAITVDGERLVAEEGDEVFIPRGVVHSVRNIDRGTTRWLYGYD